MRFVCFTGPYFPTFLLRHVASMQELEFFGRVWANFKRTNKRVSIKIRNEFETPWLDKFNNQTNVLMQDLSVPGMSLQPTLQCRVQVMPVGGVHEEENWGQEHSEGEQDREESGGEDQSSGGRSPLLVDWRPGHLLPHLVVDRPILQPHLVIGGVLLPHPSLGHGGGWLVLTVTSLTHPRVGRTLTIFPPTAGHHSLLSASCWPERDCQIMSPPESTLHLLSLTQSHDPLFCQPPPKVLWAQFIISLTHR